jgi:hypothetical protein
VSKFRYVFFFFSILLIQSECLAHDFYISISTLTYNSKSNSFEVEVKLTAHDLEKAIYQKYKQELKLASDKEHLEADVLIKNYFISQFLVWMNGAVIKPTYIGKEVHLDENLFVFLEFKCPDILHNMTIKNLLLLDYFPSQENITHVTKNDKKWSYTFSKNQQEKSFTFK